MYRWQNGVKYTHSTFTTVTYASDSCNMFKIYKINQTKNNEKDHLPFTLLWLFISIVNSSACKPCLNIWWRCSKGKSTFHNSWQIINGCCGSWMSFHSLSSCWWASSMAHIHCDLRAADYGNSVEGMKRGWSHGSCKNQPPPQGGMIWQHF